jgi:hypothetical protein
MADYDMQGAAGSAGGQARVGRHLRCLPQGMRQLSRNTSQ